MTEKWSLHTGALELKSASALAELVLEAGFDSFPVLVGDRGHMNLVDLVSGLPNFVNESKLAGVEITSAECQLTVEQLVGEQEILKVLHDSGITELTIPAFPKKGYFVRSRLTKAREALEKLADPLERLKLKLVLPVTGGSLIPSPSAAFHMVRGLPPFAFGIKLDPGAEFFEGFEAWDYTVALLMDYLCTICIRDSVLMKHPGADDVNNKGWAKRWSTAEDGMTDWEEMCRNLQMIDFDGTLLLHPMVSRSADEIKRDLHYLQTVVKNASTDSAYADVINP